MYRKISQTSSPEPKHARRRSLDLFRRNRRVSEPVLDLSMKPKPGIEQDLRRGTDPPGSPGSEASEPLLGFVSPSGSRTEPSERVTESMQDSQTSSKTTPQKKRTESLPIITESGVLDPLLAHGRLISEAPSSLGVDPRVELEQLGQTSTVELLMKNQSVGQRVSTSPSSVDSDLYPKRSGSRRLSLQPFRMKSGTSESMLQINTETRSGPGRDTGLQPRRVSISPSSDNRLQPRRMSISPSREIKSQPRRVSISPSRDIDHKLSRVSSRGGGRRLSLDLFGFILDQSESAGPRVKVESKSSSRRPSLDMFRPQKQDPSEPHLYPGSQVKSQEEVRTNIYQLFNGDCARAHAINKDTSRDQRHQYPDGNHSNCCPDVPDCGLNSSGSGDNLSSEHKGCPGDASTATAHGQTPLNCRNKVSSKHGSRTREKCLNSYSAVRPGRRISYGPYTGTLYHRGIERGTQSGIPYSSKPTRRGSEQFGTRLYGYPGSPHGKQRVECACMHVCVLVSLDINSVCSFSSELGRTLVMTSTND